LSDFYSVSALWYDTTIEEFLLDLSDFDSVSVINCKAVLINRPYRSMKLSYPVCLIYTVSQKKSSTSYFAEYFRAWLTDCKNFDGYSQR